MATKQQWKDRASKAKRRVRRMRKALKADQKLLAAQATRILQLEGEMEKIAIAPTQIADRRHA